MSSPGVKICKECGEEKSVTSFSKHPTSRDRLQYVCKKCTLIRLLNWRSNHKERVVEALIEYAKTHKEEKRRDKEKYRKSNIEKHNFNCALYKRRHPEKRQELESARRARKISNGGRVSILEWKAIKEKYNNACLCCGSKDKKLTMDHIVPLVLGGSHTPENIQPLCLSCNSRKKDKTIDYRKDVYFENI